MPRELVPKGAKEGDVINIEINIEETNKRKKRIKKLINNLFE